MPYPNALQFRARGSYVLRRPSYEISLQRSWVDSVNLADGIAGLAAGSTLVLVDPHEHLQAETEVVDVASDACDLGADGLNS